MSSSGDIVTLAQAAEHVGRPHQWLRRHLLAHERRTGHVVLVRVGDGARRPTYRVHLGRLRIACPELFDVRDPLAAAIRDSAIVGRDRLSRLDERLDEVDSKLTSISVAVRRLSGTPR